MKSPMTGKEMTLRHEKRVIEFRKESFEISYWFWYCADSQQSFTTDELDEINLAQVHNQYRSIHHLPFPDEIVGLRKKYGLSAAKMSEILGFGANVYRQYESGEVPSLSNGRLIRMASDPAKFKELVMESGALQGKPLQKCLSYLDELKEKRMANKSAYVYDLLLRQNGPDAFSGYRLPSYTKFASLVKFFAFSTGTWKTKLNKLLFYADFLHFKRNGYSITGMRYEAMKMGPVPQSFNMLYDLLVKDEQIMVEYTEFPNGAIGERFRANRDIEEGIFSESEMATIQEVAGRFRDLNTSQMIEVSHLEAAWKIPVERPDIRINYMEFGFDLSI